MNETWARVDSFIVDHLVPTDPALEKALSTNAAAGLEPQDVAPNQGKLLHILARIAGARRILEIGTLGGYSTIWLARALPDDGSIVTVEADPTHAEVARSNIETAGLAGQAELRIGRAVDILPQLEGTPPFDLIFIDADKRTIPGYLDWAVKLSRLGTVIVVDNVVRNGAVADSDSDNPSVNGIRRFFEMVAENPRLTATALQTVGSKGWDGFAIAIVN